MHEFNFEIKDIGLKYFGHNGYYALILYSDCFSVEIPFGRINEFVKLFPDVRWEDGYMLHKLKGRYMRCIDDGKLNVIGLKHITKDLTYML